MAVKLSEIYDFDIEKKKRFITANTNRIHFPKIFNLFFHMLFWGAAKPSFGWYKVTKTRYEATTTNIRLPCSPKLGT